MKLFFIFKALAQKLNSSVKQSATVHSENLSSQSESIHSSTSSTSQGLGKCNQKGVDEMTESEIKEELELLRQQVINQANLHSFLYLLNYLTFYVFIMFQVGSHRRRRTS